MSGYQNVILPSLWIRLQLSPQGKEPKWPAAIVSDSRHWLSSADCYEPQEHSTQIEKHDPQINDFYSKISNLLIDCVINPDYIDQAIKLDWVS